MKTFLRMIPILVLAVLLCAGFFVIIALTAYGLGFEFGGFFAMIGLPLPFVAGYFAPTSLRRSALVVALGAVFTLALIGALILFTRGPLQVWQLESTGALVLLVYVLISMPLLAAGRALRYQADRHRWLRYGLRGLAAAVLVAVLAFGAYLRDVGFLPFAYGSRLEAYERLWTNLDRFYAHWEIAPVKPEELQARYLPRVQAADRACQNQAGPCKPYQEAIRDMLAELRDGHTYAHVPSELASPPVKVRPIAGQAVILEVAPNSQAEEAGLARGMVITRVDGLTVEEALSRVPPYATAYSSPQIRLYAAYRSLLAGPPDAPVALTVQMADSAEKSVTLPRQGRIASQPTVEGKRLPDGLAYIAVRAETGQDVVATFDQLLDGMSNAPGLVLDIRGNGGGNSAVGDGIVGRLITQRIVYGTECLRAPHPMQAWDSGCSENEVLPRGQAYTRPVALLIDTEDASAAEWIAAALCDTGRAHCFGRTTGGMAGNPVYYFMPDLNLQFCVGKFTRLNGRLLEGSGVAPHVEVQWTLEDVRTGRDPDLQVAQKWLLAKTGD